MLLYRLAPFLIALSAPAFAQKVGLGVYGQWGAFESKEPRNCFAITAPHRAPRAMGWKPFAAVGYWPQRAIRSQVHFRLSREKRPESAVLLRIDGQTYQLIAGKYDAWAPNAAADARIVAAMRTGIEMRIETRAVNGFAVRDAYWLRGAATAIDAAAIACSR